MLFGSRRYLLYHQVLRYVVASVEAVEDPEIHREFIALCFRGNKT